MSDLTNKTNSGMDKLFLQDGSLGGILIDTLGVYSHTCMAPTPNNSVWRVLSAR